MLAKLDEQDKPGRAAMNNQVGKTEQTARQWLARRLLQNYS